MARIRGGGLCRGTGAVRLRRVQRQRRHRLGERHHRQGRHAERAAVQHGDGSGPGQEPGSADHHERQHLPPPDRVEDHRQGRDEGRARSGHRHRQVERRRQDVDVHAQERAQVLRRHAHHLQGRQVRAGAFLRRLADRRPELPQDAARGRAGLPRPVRRPGAQLHRDAERQDHHLPPQRAVRRLAVGRLARRVHPRARRQGPGVRLRQAAGGLRPVQGRVERGRQAGRLRAQHLLGQEDRSGAHRGPRQDRVQDGTGHLGGRPVDHAGHR